MNHIASNFSIFLTLLLNNHSTKKAKEIYSVIAFERDNLRLHERAVFKQIILILLASFFIWESLDILGLGLLRSLAMIITVATTFPLFHCSVHLAKRGNGRVKTAQKLQHFGNVLPGFFFPLSTLSHNQSVWK